MLLTDRPLLVAAAGYVLVVNASVSVLDVATAITLARQPAGAVLHFDGQDARGDAPDPERADAIDRDRS